MPILACLNGEVLPADEAKVPIWDRGFLFGDSIYEVFRLYGGRCWLRREHMARLRRSLAEVEFAAYDLDRLAERIDRTVALGGIAEGTVYVQITRGVAIRAHAFPDPPVPPTEVIVVRPYDDAATAEKRRSGVAAVGRPDLRWGRCDVKSTNLLGNVLALESAKRAGAAEAILVDRDGLVTEATHSSLFWVRDGVLEGTPEGPEILPGTTRHFAVGLAGPLGIAFRESRITLDDLKRADEVILAGTTIEVLPVATVDDATIGDGRPGPVATRLQAAHREAVDRWLATHTA